MRRLQLTPAGQFYILLTIALGVVALVSANNVLYLIESLLLSGLILSGVLSERFVSSVHIDFVRMPAIAGAQSYDQIRITNLRRFPVFCLEIGEWRGKKFHPIAFVDKLKGKGAIRLRSEHRFEKRGVHTWEGFGIATSYPFGFARKLKIVKFDAQQKRLVWPEKASTGQGKRRAGLGGSAHMAGMEITEGEVRAATHEDDYRMMVWTLSARGTDPMVRPRRIETDDPEITLDLRTESPEELEKRVLQAAQPFHSQERRSQRGTLVLIQWSGKRRIIGKEPVLDQLALARLETPAREKRRGGAA